ncbi:ImuA family protein [Aliiroseovarius sp. YM-037]|uniref:ImuA family protein n=1 Tax=Aliiroseovarius sp. YM-037 TaxID=3341728 RepID=UPI003A8013F1
MKRKLAGRNEGVPSARSAAMLSEVFPTTAVDAGALGFVLSRLPRTSSAILWIQDRLSQKEAGRPYLPGLGAQRPILRVDVTRPVDVLWAMEDGLRCKGLCAVIGEIWGDPPALSFTATKRLALRAEAGQVPCWLIRRASSPDLSAARDRWRVASVPSAPHPDDAKAPGDPRWRVELFRSRQSRPGEWLARYDSASDRVHFTAPLRDGAVAEGDGTLGQRAAG